MDDSLLVRMLHRAANLQEQLQALRSGEMILIAELRDSDAADQFHDEIRSSSRRGSSIKHACDIGMIHHRKGLAFLLEARDHLLGIHAELDNLQRDTPLDGLQLLRHPDNSESAFADLLE
jgi:hypothetical protein